MADVFRGISIGDIEISHLLYAEDIVVPALWSLENVAHIVFIFQCFFLALGLKINIHKNKLIGVGVTPSQVVEVVSYMDCASNSLPFIHLGVPVGHNMNR